MSLFLRQDHKSWVLAISLFLVGVHSTVVTAQDPSLDLEIFLSHRVSRIQNSYLNPDLASQLASSLLPNGTWSDVDYTSGCLARRANWPAQDHFHRINTMAAVWSTTQDPILLTASLSAIDHWFSNDFPSDDCINGGGRDSPGLTCPCGTPGYWNTNWYCQMILMPGLIGSACLLLSPALSPGQLESCLTVTSRSWERIDGDPNGTGGRMTGANLLDVASIGASLALLSQDHDLLLQSLDRVWGECTVNEEPSEDGIKVDGAFLQHDAQIYTGNYGKVFITQMLTTFSETKGTSLSSPEEVRNAFKILLEGSEWLIYRKGEGAELSWSYSAIGRMVSFKRADWHGIDLGLDRILDATEEWEDAAVFEGLVERLRDQEDGGSGLVGSRFFHSADFLVNRGIGYSTTLKMYSSRTTNSECNNGQSPFGYHLSDGTIYTQRTGDEYTDVFGAWDWDLIPGTTTLYQSVPLSCGNVQTRGRSERVGAVTLTPNDNTPPASVAIMSHIDPKTGSHSWTKTFFFFPSSYVVQFPEIWWDPVPSTGRMRTTLDQRVAGQDSGPVWIDGVPLSDDGIRELEAETVWYDGVGYAFQQPVPLGVGLVSKVANWSAIGISVGNETQNHFLAYLTHAEANTDGRSYVVRLNVDQEEFQSSPQGPLSILMPSDNVTGALYQDDDWIILGLAFTSTTNYSTGLEMIPWVAADVPVLLLFQRSMDDGWNLAVADHTPSQEGLPTRVTIAASVEGVIVQERVELPVGPWAGSSVYVQLFKEKI